MKNKAAHITAGFCVGLMFYATFLACFTLLVAPRNTYWIWPIPNTADDNYRRAATFYMLWQFNPLEVIVILLGLLFPLVFAGISYIKAVKHPVQWVRRWYIQAGFAIGGLIAAWQILEKISRILPVPLSHLI